MITVGDLIEKLLEYDPEDTISVQCMVCNTGSDAMQDTLKIKDGIKGITICVNK